MIEIEVVKKEKQYRIISKGHAGYAPEGEDIVCAGISSLMLFLAGVAACSGGELVEMRSGYTEVIILENSRTKLVIESLKITLETMRIRYEKYFSFSFAGV